VLPIARSRLGSIALYVALVFGAAPTIERPAIADEPDVVRSVALRAGLGRMAEADIAIDPGDPLHLVAAADPYDDPVRIAIAESADGGKTWGSAQTLVPPGFSKSYDPTVRIEPDGDVVVVGGASQEGEPDCQPGSAIFLARIAGGDVGYEVIQGPKPDTYFDRPRMTQDEQGLRTYVSWTRSKGAGAECLAVPMASTTMLARSGPDGGFWPRRPLPSTGLPAPFGSSLAVDPHGRLYLSVAERAPGEAVRVVLMWSEDEGRTFSNPQVIGENPELPSSVPGLGGFVASVPTVTTGPDGRVAVAWASPSFEGSETRVFERLPDGTVHRLSTRSRPERYELFPNVAYDPWGDLWLLTGREAAGPIRFVLRTRTAAGWSRRLELGTGPAAPYAEVGQFLGLAAEGNTVAAAAPVNGETESSLQILTLRREDALPAGAPEAAGPRTAHESATRATEDRAAGTEFLVMVTALTGAGFVVGVVLLRRRG